MIQGLTNSPTKYFILSGLVIHETDWQKTLDSLLEFRRYLKQSKNLKIRDEIHAINFINKPGELVRIKRNDRLDILKKCLDWLNNQNNLRIITVVVNKQNKNTDKDIFEYAWNALITRFENTIRAKNFPNSTDLNDKGLLLPDNTDGEKLTKIVRKLRHYNPVPNNTNLYTDGYRNIKLDCVIEDPFMKDSKNSLLHQMVDVVAYAARQLYEPNSYMKKKSGTNFYKRIENIILKQASKKHELGIVEI